MTPAQDDFPLMVVVNKSHRLTDEFINAQRHDITNLEKHLGNRLHK